MSYREGIIYSLFSPNTNQCYIGCTTKDLKTTFTHLRAYSKRNRGVSSNVIIEAGEAQIEVLETFHDITISALRKELGKVQEKYADVCVNIHRAGRTVKDRYHLDSTNTALIQNIFYFFFACARSAATRSFLHTGFFRKAFTPAFMHCASISSVTSAVLSLIHI